MPQRFMGSRVGLTASTSTLLRGGATPVRPPTVPKMPQKPPKQEMESKAIEESTKLSIPAGGQGRRLSLLPPMPNFDLEEHPLPPDDELDLPTPPPPPPMIRSSTVELMQDEALNAILGQMEAITEDINNELA